jgi:hypothetical protein
VGISRGLLLLLCLGTAGCAGSGEPSIATVASGFYRAYSNGDGRAACGLLAPQTRHEVVQSAQMPCASGVLKEDIPKAGSGYHTVVFGDQAQVTSSTDTSFLAHFAAGWKIVAVGCRKRAELPYDCQVKGS